MVVMLKLYPQPHHRGRATLVSKQSTNLANALGAPIYGSVVLQPSFHRSLLTFQPDLWLFLPLFCRDIREANHLDLLRLDCSHDHLVFDGPA
jgi:hypothetical protein